MYTPTGPLFPGDFFSRGCCHRDRRNCGGHLATSPSSCRRAMQCPVRPATADVAESGSATDAACGSAKSSGCPVTAAAGSSGINPANQMPAPNQQPATGQRLPLSTERIRSTIPGPKARNCRSCVVGGMREAGLDMFCCDLPQRACAAVLADGRWGGHMGLPFSAGRQFLLC